jgi:hypothetical protein
MMSRETDGTVPEAAATASRTPWVIGIAAFLAIFVAGTALTIGTAEAPPPPTPAAPAPRQTAKPTMIEVPSLGLAVAQPKGWQVVTAQQHARNLRSVEMDDPQFQDLVIRYANVPIVALSKYAEPYADLNPSFKVNVRPAGPFMGRPATEILAAALPTLSRAFADMAIEEGPVPTMIANHPAAYARLSYTMKADGQAYPTISEFWIVPRGSIFFMIGVGTRADERNGTRAEARTIVHSLQIQ